MNDRNELLSRKAALFAMASAIAFASAPASLAQALPTAMEERDVSLASGPLEETLLKLSDIWSVNIYFPQRLVLGKQAPTLSGSYSAQAAISAVLEGTGLEAKPNQSGDYLVTVAAEEPSERADVSPAPTYLPETDDPLVSETIIVTGQKLERSLQDTKESVAVINSEIVQERTLLDFRDAALQTPNISSSGDGAVVTIRGITTSSGNSVSIGGSGDVGLILYDNVPFSGEARGFVPQNFWDVDQIEYLRGPQSTNVGRSALAGAVVIRTMEPSLDELEGAARAEYGNFNTYALEGMLNIPLAETLALRVTGENSQTDGFVDNALVGDQFVDESSNIRARLLFEPNDRFSILASIQYLDIGSVGGEVTVLDGEDIESFTSTQNVANVFEYEGVLSSLELDYQFCDEWSVTSITSLLDGQYNQVLDTDRTAADTGTIDQIVDEKTLTQEIRFTYDSDHLRGAIGGFYFNFDSGDDRSAVFSGDLAQAGVPPELLIFYSNPTIVTAISETNGTVENTALYTQWEYDLTEKLEISAGFRYDIESIEQDLVQVGVVDPNTPLPDPVAAGQLADMQQPGLGPIVEAGITQLNGLVRGFAPNAEEAFDTEYEAFLPEFGLTYALTPNSSVSAFYKRGYRAGGAEVLIDGTVNTFDPEYIDNFELALRSKLLDGNLNFNANAFYGEWTDQQVRVPFESNLGNLATINLGESQIWGAEVQTDYDLTDDTSVFASLGYANTEFTKACRIGSSAASLPDCEIDGAAGKDIAGNDFPLSPDWTASIGARHSFSKNWFVQANATYQDGQFTDVENAREFENDSFALLNASAGYEGEHLSVTLYGRNLTDEFSTTSLLRQGGIGILRVSPIAPRTYGVIVSAAF